MMIKYLHIEQPNTQSEHYLKRIKDMSLYLTNVTMRMRTWVCYAKMYRQGIVKMITQRKWLCKWLKMVRNPERMGSGKKRKWKWGKGLRYGRWVHNAIPGAPILWAIGRLFGGRTCTTPLLEDGWRSIINHIRRSIGMECRRRLRKICVACRG